MADLQVRGLIENLEAGSPKIKQETKSWALLFG